MDSRVFRNWVLTIQYRMKFRLMLTVCNTLDITIAVFMERLNSLFFFPRISLWMLNASPETCVDYNENALVFMQLPSLWKAENGYHSMIFSKWDRASDMSWLQNRYVLMMTCGHPYIIEFFEKLGWFIGDNCRWHLWPKCTNLTLIFMISLLDCQMFFRHQRVCAFVINDLLPLCMGAATCTPVPAVLFITWEGKCAHFPS